MTTLEQTAIRGPFTWADIADAPDDGLRREIIGGTLIMSPAPANRHQMAVVRLAQLLDEHRPDGLTVVPALYDWRYDDDSVVEPDLVVCRTVDIDLDGPLVAPAVPVLLVEVQSPSNAGYDRGWKRELYERLGVAHYWLVDPGAKEREPSIAALALDPDGRYETTATATGADQFVAVEPIPVTVAPADLLRL